jgi:hypothetical protein
MLKPLAFGFAFFTPKKPLLYLFGVSPSMSSITTIDPYQFYDLVKIAEEFKRPEGFDDMVVDLDLSFEALEEDAEFLSEAYNAMLAEARRSTRRAPSFKEEPDEMRFEHVSGGTNFVALILHYVKTFHNVTREVRDIIRDIQPVTFLFLGDRALPTSAAQLQEFSSVINLNSPKVSAFSTTVGQAYTLPKTVIDLARGLTRVQEAYYQLLVKRHSIEGIKIQVDPVRTDLALCLYENIDGHGEVAEGKKIDEISAYSMRKAELLADTLTSEFFQTYLKDPGEVVKYLKDQLLVLWDVANQISKATKDPADKIRKLLRRGLPPRLPTQQDFKEVILTLEDLDPQNIDESDKVGILSPEEKVCMDFRNETLLTLSSMLGKATSQELVRYVLSRKEKWHIEQRDVNSFYVCRIGSGNAFGGEAPGMLEIIPGIKPKVNLDEVVGQGFDEVRAMIEHARNSSKWTDLFMATSPSKKVDKMNVLLVGPQGCHRKGQKILMYDGRLMPVEEIVVGDLLMGPDSTPRKVLELRRGVEEMVEIRPTKGEPWVVNKSHTLTLVRTSKKIGNWGKGKPKYLAISEVKDVSLNEYLTWSKTQKNLHPLFRASPVEFSSDSHFPIDPYFLGVLLGDGCLMDRVNVTTLDESIVQEVHYQAEKYGLRVSVDVREGKCPSYHLSGVPGKPNPITAILRQLQLFNCDSGAKFIPHSYKVAPKEQRLGILAGLLDTDGSMHDNCFDYVSKSRALAEDVSFIVRSLGMAAYISPTRKKDQNGVWGDYWRVSISGHTDQIPVRIDYKKASPRKQVKNVLRTSFKTKELPPEEYYGFLLDGDHRYLLGDFTVTHNCGKSEVLRALGSDPKSIGIFAQASDFLTCWKSEAEKNPKRLFEAGLKLQKESKRQVFFLIDEIDTILNGDRGQAAFGGTNLATEFQILMDGITSYPNVALWGATNHPERIPMPLLRRFAKVIVVGELNLKDRVQLLRRFTSYLPLAEGFDEETWMDVAKMLDGAVGDTVRKVTDHVWREKMFNFVSKKPVEAEAIVAYLQEGGTHFDPSKATAEWRARFHDKLRPYVQIRPGDLLEAAQVYLDNPAIKQEIKTAVETYKVAKEHLVGMVTPRV